MIKQSFTLFEVIISLILFSITLSTIIKLFGVDNHINTYYELQQMENQYIQTKNITNTEKIVFKIY